MKEYSEVIKQFELKGTVSSVTPLGNGLINDTLKIETSEPDCPDYVLQRINNKIFTDVDKLQHNIEATTAHIRKKLSDAGVTDIDRKVLTFVPASNGKTYYFDGECYWRISVFIPRSVTYDVVDPHYSYLAGKGFGQFQSMLADIEETLDETIPDFHNMEFRLKQFNDAITENKAGRLSDVKDLVDALLARSEKMCAAEQLHRDGRLPKRICHCDTKVNNMLFDADDNSFLCVIDLDTVMPSYIFSDYGDFLRTAANTAPEDEPDISKIHFRPEIFKAFTQGYLESAKSFLTDIEIENLPYAVALFPYMQCVRFLTDYLNGDTYYKILYPEHNKVRSYAQYELFSQVEAAQEELSEVIKNLVNH